MIFGTCLIEACAVDAHPKLPIGLRDDHRIAQPPGVVDLPYEASVEQLFDLFMDKVLPLNRLLLGPLLDRSGIGVDLQMVLNHLARDPRHLRWLPGKHIDISPEEGDEHEFYLLSRSPEIRVVCPATVPTWTVFTGTSSDCMRGAEADPR
jgi:hypothetical protein